MPRTAPNARRRDELINRRLLLGFTQESLGEMIGVSADTIAAWERGVYLPLPRYRPRLAEALEVHVIELDRLLYPEAPLVIDSHKVPTWLSHYESLAEAAQWLGAVEAVSIHGLLQTRAYAEVVERAAELPPVDELVFERVDLRLARQAALARDRDPLHLTAIIPEHLLRADVGGPQVMYEQLSHLIRIAERPNVELLVLPADGRATCFVNGFELLTKPGTTNPFMVVTLDVGGARYHEDPHLVERFLSRFKHLVDTALTQAESTALITTIRESHR
jgi:transcriptional regulator with XRE-family HTH domain